MLSSPKGSANDAPTVYSVPSWPRKITIDVDGKVACDPDTALNTQLVLELLTKVKPENKKYELKGPPEPPKLDYSKKFDAALKAIKATDWKAADAELVKLEKEAGTDGENAKALSKWIGEQGKSRLEDAESDIQAESFLEAAATLADIIKKWPASAEVVKTATDKLAGLKKDKTSDSAKVLAMEKTWQGAQAAEAKGDKARAIGLYQKCVDGCAGTKFAQRCKDRIAALSR